MIRTRDERRVRARHAADVKHRRKVQKYVVRVVSDALKFRRRRRANPCMRQHRRFSHSCCGTTRMTIQAHVFATYAPCCALNRLSQSRKRFVMHIHTFRRRDELFGAYDSNSKPNGVACALDPILIAHHEHGADASRRVHRLRCAPARAQRRRNRPDRVRRQPTRETDHARSHDTRDDDMFALAPGGVR